MSTEASPGTDPRVRPAQASDLAAIGACLGHAFDDDPVMGWLVGDHADRHRRISTVLELNTTMHLGHGQVFVASIERGGPVAAVAVWAHPRRWHVPLRRYLRHVVGFGGVLGVAGLRRAASLRVVEQAHPREHHHYLAVLGTHPDAQGRGLGASLVRAVTTGADRELMPAYLECSKPSNVGYYQRLGFEAGDVIDIAPDVSVTAMWRDPQPD